MENSIKTFYLDATHEYAAVKVGGITLCERNIKIAFATGYDRVVLVTKDKSEPQLYRQNIFKRLYPEKIIEQIDEIKLQKTDSLSANSIQLSNGLQIIVKNNSDLEKAKTLLSNDVRKKNTGLLMYYIYGPIAIRISKTISQTFITPNQVTIFNFCLAIICAILIATGQYQTAVMGGILYQFTLILDSVDGEVSRIRVEGTKFGAWLDGMSDVLTESVVLIGLSLGMYLTNQTTYIAIISTISAFIFGFKTAVLLYSEKLLTDNPLQEGFHKETNIKNFFEMLKENPIKTLVVYLSSYEIRRGIVLIGLVFPLKLAVVLFFALWYSTAIIFIFIKVYLQFKDKPLTLDKWKNPFLPSKN